MTGALVGLCLFLGGLLAVVWRSRQQLRRDEYIRNAPLPAGLLDRLAKRRPELTLKDRVLVSRALRQFFLAYLHSGRRFVAMPSQVVDDLWHEWILYTRNYEAFCRQAFGRFLHHTPAVALSPDRRNNEGLRRVWWYACKEENLNPRNPTRLPLLFALDAKFGLAEGYVYAADCKALRERGEGNVHCGADFGDSSIDGGSDGFADASDSSGGDAGGDGGGDSGGSCGGGCGGGD